ncbi:opsin 4b [Centroberyx affinis]|uniref:opsin 4b n=1 Tax=Centroberyx affinis TaxID=166261 RepID=UPI003A5C068A
MDSRLLIAPGIPTPDPTSTTAAGTGAAAVETRAPWNISSVSAHRLMELPPVATSVSMVPSHPFPTVDVPDHAHYTIGAVILTVGITGMLGNFLVMYAFCRSRSLRTPANMFIINLAITDFLMCVTQTPIFFTTSMHKRWIFGKKGCELYAFCGALFGICSMITLMVIAVDRYVVITRPLASLGVMSRRKALGILAAAWVYSMGWSLPPFFGWSAYVPEGLLTSCSWDYMTFTPSVRSYTMLLFTFVFFIPLSIIIFCYCCIFRAIRRTTRAITKINCEGNRDSVKRFHKMKSEWKMAKIALIVILLYVISWAPYSCVALTAFAGYADMLTPYMNSVPAVIAKASAIHNPIIYAITHPKYRSAISRYIPYLGVLLCMTGRDRFSSSSFQSTRRSTLTSQSSESSRPTKPRLSSQSDSESVGLSDTEADLSSRTPGTRQLSSDVKQVRHASQRSKVRGRDSGVFERAAAHNPTDPSICRLTQVTTLTEPEDISMSDISLQPTSHLPATLDNVTEELGSKAVCKETSSIIVTSMSSPSALQSPTGFHGNQAANLKMTKTCSSVAKEPLKIARLETPLPCIAGQKHNDSV